MLPFTQAVTSLEGTLAGRAAALVSHFPLVPRMAGAIFKLFLSLFKTLFWPSPAG